MNSASQTNAAGFNPEIKSKILAAPEDFRALIKNYVRYPSERNSCYFTGYASALINNQLIDDNAFWMAIAGQIKESEKLREHISSFIS